MIRVRKMFVVIVVLAAACGSSTSQAAPSPKAAELVSVAALVYPEQGSRYVTCDAGYAGPERYSRCPLTKRLNDRLTSVFSGLISAPEPLGGGQDPEWATRSITADPTGTGGIAHVTLAKPSSHASRYDLVIVRAGGSLLVDDVYCSRTDRPTSSIYADGWMNRFGC